MTDPVAPDYNNGEWHTWNGGECPVHPKSVVEVRLRSGFNSRSRFSGEFAWWHDQDSSDITSFRVVTHYVEPAPDPVTPPADRDLRDFDLTNPYGTPYGLLDEVYGSGAADAMIAHGGPWQQYTQGAWREVDSPWIDQRAYRVKPEHEVVTITMVGDIVNGFSHNPLRSDTHKIAFNTIDGKPDCASIRMEPLE